MLFVFLRMCNFLLFIPFESSCRILKPSNRGFKRPLAAVMAPSRSFLMMPSGDSVRSGRKTNQFAGEKKGRIFQKLWHSVRSSVSYGASIKAAALFAVITGKCYKFSTHSESRIENKKKRKSGDKSFFGNRKVWVIQFRLICCPHSEKMKHCLLWLLHLFHA